MSRSVQQSVLTTIVAATALLTTACRDNSVSYYEVPREKSAAPLEAGSAGAPAEASLHWSKPNSWQESAGSSMRLASYAFTAPDGGVADISVTRFPDSAGGLLANINRWRGQVGLEPTPADALETTATRTQIAGQVAWLVDFAGTPPDGEPTRITGAIVPVSGTSWFFKMMGPDAVVQSQQPAFHELIASIHAVAPGDAHHHHGDEAPTPPDPHANVPGAPPLTNRGQATSPTMDPAAVPPPPAAAKISYDVPAGWTEKSAGGFRVASFAVENDLGAPADVSVITLSGPAGGELANVNRWRGQVGLPATNPVDLEQDAATVSGESGSFRVFDLDGTNGQRVLAAIRPETDRTWFIKMTGESAHVGAQRENFETFLRSIRFEPNN